MTTLSTRTEARAVTPLRQAKSPLAALLLAAGSAQAVQFTIPGPNGSGAFGTTVTTLSNGNIVVTDPSFDAPGPILDVGAVYLYRPDGMLISTLRGSTTGDQVGSRGVVVLADGNYLVRSPAWDNAPLANAGAVTFGLADSGVNGVVSPSNSLVGANAEDLVGEGVVALANGNYVVSTSFWDNGAVRNVGAVTFGSGNSGISGLVSAANSLIGSKAQDQVGSGVVPLANGNYVVLSLNWDNDLVVNAGAVTFGSGSSGVSGLVSATNSLVGTNSGDLSSFVVALSNGNYVIVSQFWDNGALANVGAVTFASGSVGIVGTVSSANSLIGSSPQDTLGASGVTPLSNGNYVVSSFRWDNGSIANVGAATFGSGSSGISGVVSAANSLVGSSLEDRIGWTGVTALSNGNYVVSSAFWDHGAMIDVGAVTLGSGGSGIVGSVSLANSLVGSQAQDQVGNPGVMALSNGNYVVRSTNWDNGSVINAGAATFRLGSSGVGAVVSTANSLLGSTAQDQVGGSAVALSNGNYVIASALWDNGAVINAGAATFATGSGGISGVISSANSLVGTQAEDQVGSLGVTALTTGSYLVRSGRWSNGPLAFAGAVTFGSGSSGISGFITPANSLVGSRALDGVGGSDAAALSDGNYVLSSWGWDNAAIVNAGAITLGLSNGSVTGFISETNSVLGGVAEQGISQVFSYDAARKQLAVGQPASNRVVLLTTMTVTDLIFANGFESP